MSRGCRGYLLALTGGVRCRGSSIHGIPSIGPAADARVTLNPQAKAEINNLGRLLLTVHNCARSIPDTGGERVFKLGSRYSYRRQHSGPNRSCDRRDAFLSCASEWIYAASSMRSFLASFLWSPAHFLAASESVWRRHVYYCFLQFNRDNRSADAQFVLARGEAHDVVVERHSLEVVLAKPVLGSAKILRCSTSPTLFGGVPIDEHAH